MRLNIWAAIKKVKVEISIKHFVAMKIRVLFVFLIEAKLFHGRAVRSVFHRTKPTSSLSFPRSRKDLKTLTCKRLYEHLGENVGSIERGKLV